jgi:uncharacterized protein YmfQ (DUF2313 family)
MGHAELLSQLLIPESYSPTAPNLAAELQADANALDAVLTNAQRALAAITPYGAGETLPDWERVLAIAPSSDATYQQRINAVITKIRQKGGLSIPYFIQLAASLGYTITIIEPQPFRVDASRIGDALYDEDVIYIWQVEVEGSATLEYYFRVDQSAIGEPLMAFSDPVLEQVFNDLKPAWTFVYFTYQG